MKRMAAIAFAVALVFACRNQSETTSATNTTETVNTTGTETTGTTSTTSTGSSGGTVASLSTGDKEFIAKAAQGGMSEVQMGQMAASKGTTNDVKDFANRMVVDHGKGNDELKQLATTKGLALPAEPAADQKKTANDLSKKSAMPFDRAYITEMVKDHEKDVAEFEKASKDAQDPDLKSWVTKTLPTLQDHLRMAKQIAAKLK